MVSKIPVKTVNRVYSKAAVIPFPTPQQNIYMGYIVEKLKWEVNKKIKFELQLCNYTYK